MARKPSPTVFGDTPKPTENSNWAALAGHIVAAVICLQMIYIYAIQSDKIRNLESQIERLGSK